jgi:hypothetical protein
MRFSQTGQRGMDLVVFGSDEVDTAQGADSFAVDGLAGKVLAVGVVAGCAGLGDGELCSLHERGEMLAWHAEKPHNGCSKFRARFGDEAPAFVNSVVGKELRLRGFKARVVTSGTVRPATRSSGSADARRLSRPDEAGLVGEYDGLDPVTGPDLGQRVCHVALDRRLPEVEIRGDLCVGETARQQLQHLTLSCGQPAELLLRGRVHHGAAEHVLLDKSHGQPGVEQRAPSYTVRTACSRC